METRRPVVIAGDRYDAEFGASDVDADLAYGFLEDAAGWTELGRMPVVERPLRLSRVSSRLPNVRLFAPFGGKPRTGVREIFDGDPRLSRLWGRFSVDVGVAMERDARCFADRVVDTGARILIVEDGDRYAIRAMCAFAVRGEEGRVVELLHDRSVAGMRGASHLLGLALRAMSDAGAQVARAISFSHSGSFPIFVRHAFIPRASSLHFAVRAEDETLAAFISRREHWYVSYLDAEDSAR